MSQMITKDLVCFDVTASNKEDIIRLLAEKMNGASYINDLETYIEAVMEREKDFSTSVGFGIATPHAKTDAVKRTCIAFARLKEDLQWDESDKVNLIIQLAVTNEDATDTHLRILASISRKLVHKEFRDKLISAKTQEEIVELFGEMESL